ncbi:MAG: LssY C-terminal domain-containing protein [Bryobacteraceae bacterium]
MLLAAAAGLAIELPTGAEMHVRLKTKIASDTSRAKDPVEAVVIAPVVAGGEFAVPAGAIVRGVVTEALPVTDPNKRAVIGLAFQEMETGGKKLKMSATITKVDNARESVAEGGRIAGILPSETLTARMDAGIGMVGQRFAALASVLGAAKGAFFKETQPEIVYEPGVEFTIMLTAPLEVPAASPPALDPVTGEEDLIEIAVKQPFQTVAQNPPKPSDITNLMYIGTEEQVRKAFAEAGWSGAAALSGQSKLETFRAIVEERGYKEAPVSILLLDGRPPDLVFQKMNNTFAMRHHLRIWRRPVTFQGKPVWVCAATHDTGIEFSEKNRTFIHKIDSQIDRERAKVVNDLMLTGMVKSLALVERPEVPQHSANATGDEIETDAQIAVVIF